MKRTTHYSETMSERPTVEKLRDVLSRCPSQGLVYLHGFGASKQDRSINWGAGGSGSKPLSVAGSVEVLLEEDVDESE